MPLFRPYGSYVVSVAPVSVAVADVNGDEHLDLLVTNYMDDSVSVLLGYGGGGFTPVPVTGPGAYARQIVAGDLDGDGDIDYLAASLSGNSITVGLNTGNGIFVAGTSVVVHSGTRGVDLADLDGDGDLDFVSVNYDSDSLAVRLNNGDGTFATGAHLTTGGTRPVQIVIADFNADGIADLATTNSVNDTVGVLIGNGDATFAAPATFATGGQPRGITAADIDGDGFSDLLVTNFTGNSVSVLRNDGAGGFLPPVNYATGYQPYDVKVGDLDGDGDIDVVVSNSGTNSLSVLLNDGSGQFSQPAGSVIALGTSPAGLSLGDFDEDGDLDIATINYHLNSTTILLNRMATYSVSATSDDEGTAGNGGELVFTIARTATSEAEDVFLALTGTADANTDYTAPGGLTIRFAAGQGTATVRIAITADADVEADETVTLTLTATSGEGRISDIAGAATATIRNDDAINIAPSGADRTLTLLEDGSRALTVADFGFGDADGHALSAVRIAALPTAGALTLGGLAVTAGQSVSASAIAAGDLIYTPAPNQAGAAVAVLTFQVQDDGGTAQGGIDLDPTPNTITFNVTPVNDAPALKVTQIVSTLAEDLPTTAATKIATLAVLDPDGGANQLSIGGADAHLFEIRQGAVWLKAGAVLDHASNPVLDLVLLLDDPRIGTGPEAREALRIKLTAPPETLTGTEAHDRLTGTSAAETLDGRGGNDQLNGGAGNDILIGGTGTDLLRGGAGADTFVFTSPRDSAPGAPSYINNGDLNALAGAGARDIIQDFTKGQDVIDLSMMDTDRGQAGDQAFVWKGNGAFSHRTADLIYRQFDSTGTAHDKTVIYGDLDRDGRADFQIELTGLIDLSRGDFLL